MSELIPADIVWNRACLEAGGPQPRDGDRALASLLAIHSVAMNGGVAHSVELHDDDQLRQGCAGFRYFDLAPAAEVIEWVAGQLASIDSDLDAMEALEAEADRRYAEIIPSDSTLEERFADAFSSRPDRFAPLGP